VNNYIIDKNGTLIFDEQTGEADARHLLAELSARGYVHEETASETPANPEPTEVDSASVELSETHTDVASDDSASVVTDSDKLTIEFPLEGFTSTALENLQRLILGKAALIMKAIGADALPVERTETLLRFPWFPVTESGAEADSYSRFIVSVK